MPILKFTVNRFHLVPYISHRDMHDGVERQLTLEAIHGLPVGINNQAMSYTLGTGAGITYRQASLNCPSVYEGANLGTAAN